MTETLTTYIVRIKPARFDGEQLEITAENWTRACGIALDDTRVSEVKRLSHLSSIYDCYRMENHVQHHVGQVMHEKTLA